MPARRPAPSSATVRVDVCPAVPSGDANIGTVIVTTNRQIWRVGALAILTLLASLLTACGDQPAEQPTTDAADPVEADPDQDGPAEDDAEGYVPATTSPREEVAEGLEDVVEDPDQAIDQAAVADDPAAEDAVAAPAPDDPRRITPIDDGFAALMRETTWEPDCPVAIEELRTLTVPYVTFDGGHAQGELIVHHEVAEDVLQLFAALYADRFPIARIEPIEHVGGDDDAAMAANLTTAFNCRRITGGSRWSEHAYGWAIDINPIQNPYQRGDTVLPPGGEPYLDRADVRSGMLTRPGPIDDVDRMGWGWGGDWSSLVDYMHISLTGR